MILFNLLTLRADHALAVTELVLRERFAHDAFVDEAIATYHLDVATDTLINRPLYRVLFLTKAMLYRDLEQRLATAFPDHDFRYYATAITQVDEREANRIRLLVRAV